MTSFGDLAVAQLLGGIAGMLGGHVPAAPPPAAPPTLPGGKFGAVSQQPQHVNPAPAPPYPGTSPRVPPYAGMPWPPASPSRDAGPGQTPPPHAQSIAGDAGDGLTGDAAEAARQVDDALQKHHSAVNDADAQLTDAILRATASDQHGKDRLAELQQSIVDEVKKLGPTLDTPAGQQQLADFLQGKTGEILEVVKSARLDAASHGAVLDGLAARYAAARTEPGGSGGQSGPGSSAPASTAAAAPPASALPNDPPAADPLPDDALLRGLAPDPLMAGLGSLSGPGLGGLPGMMGSMMPPFGAPIGGGGSPLGDIGAAIREAVHGADGSPGTERPDEVKDQPARKADRPRDPAKPEPLQAQPDTAKAAAGPSGAQPAGADATPAHDRPAAGPPPADTSVKLPDGTRVSAASPALAKAGRAVLGGADINDAYQQAGIALSAPGTPVSSPVSPSKLAFGDVGQFTDHRVLALGAGKVWVNGQVCPLDRLDTGPNFLGWEHPPAAAPVAAAQSAASAPAPSGGQ